MNSRQIIILVLVAAMAGTIAFAATRMARTPQTTSPAPTTRPVPVSADPTATLMNWLNVPEAQRHQIATHDPAFAADLSSLRSSLNSRREALAAALGDVNSPDQIIELRVEEVIAASNALERRVMKHLLEVRDHLTADQQKQLFGLCAEGVRQGNGWGWGRGHGMGGGGRGMGPGMMGGGRGMGPGMQRRGER